MRLCLLFDSLTHTRTNCKGPLNCAQHFEAAVRRVDIFLSDTGSSLFSLSLSLSLARSIFLRLLTVWRANWKFGKRRPCHTHTHTPADSANKRDRRICVWSRGRTSVSACLRIIGNGSAIYWVGLKSFAEEVTGIIPAFFSLWHDGDKDDDNDERYLSWIMK